MINLEFNKTPIDNQKINVKAKIQNIDLSKNICELEWYVKNKSTKKIEFANGNIENLLILNTNSKKSYRIKTQKRTLFLNPDEEYSNSITMNNLANGNYQYEFSAISTNGEKVTFKGTFDY